MTPAGRPLDQPQEQQHQFVNVVRLHGIPPSSTGQVEKSGQAMVSRMTAVGIRTRPYRSRTNPYNAVHESM